ncbi:Rik1-associated factor 1 [Asimina triloba]
MRFDVSVVGCVLTLSASFNPHPRCLLRHIPVASIRNTFLPLPEILQHAELPLPALLPPSSQPAPHQSLSLEDLLDILRNRLGLWHHYAPHISTLHRHFSFFAPALEESTSISSGEQNRLIVVVQVRDSLIASKVDDQVLSFFDFLGDTELLYELRLLFAAQRAVVARYFADRRVEDTKVVQDVTRAIKDFPRRRGEEGWDASRPPLGIASHSCIFG